MMRSIEVGNKSGSQSRGSENWCNGQLKSIENGAFKNVFPLPRYDKKKLGLTEKVFNDSSVHIQLDLSCEPGVHMLTFYGDKDSDETGKTTK